MTKLRRTLTLPMLTLYGLGNILGAGIYILIGEVAGRSGNGIIWSFIVAAIVASFTAISYGALSGTFPRSAGAAIYTQKAFKAPWFSTLIGLLLALTAIVSSSTLLRGFDRYFQDLLLTTELIDSKLPSVLVMLPLLLILGFIAYKGIKESAKLAVIFTLLEALGLVIVIAVASRSGSIVESLSSSVTSFTAIEPTAILLGGFLAFYAFVGFEDMVNIAEEVKQPKVTMRKGMVYALSIATILYIATAVSALAVVSSEQLADSDAPLATVFQAATNSTLPLITIIGVIAITNGVLIQIITSSRILYGLATEKWIPSSIASVSPKTHTPVTATIIVVMSIAVASSILPLSTLAQITSFILLIIFTVVHLSAYELIRNKQLKNLSFFVPLAGIVTNCAVIILQLLSWANILN